MPVYLDNAATTRVCPEAAQAAMAYEQQIAEQPVRTAPPRN